MTNHLGTVIERFHHQKQTSSERCEPLYDTTELVMGQGHQMLQVTLVTESQDHGHERRKIRTHVIQEDLLDMMER